MLNLTYISTHACMSACMSAQSFSHVQLFVTLWIVVYQAPRGSPGKDTGLGCHFLLQGIFLNQGLNSSLLHLLHWQTDSLLLASPGKPVYVCLKVHEYP